MNAYLIHFNREDSGIYVSSPDRYRHCTSYPKTQDISKPLPAHRSQSDPQNTKSIITSLPSRSCTTLLHLRYTLPNPLPIKITRIPRSTLKQMPRKPLRHLTPNPPRKTQINQHKSPVAIPHHDIAKTAIHMTIAHAMQVVEKTFDLLEPHFELLGIDTVQEFEAETKNPMLVRKGFGGDLGDSIKVRESTHDVEFALDEAAGFVVAGVGDFDDGVVWIHVFFEAHACVAAKC
jgi:hypothetical protein